MKVCTDSCILGAYTSAPAAGKILDIGTGTGLLSLMLAQKHPHTCIDAIEIDEQAYQQAHMNIAASPWPDRIRLYHQTIQAFSPSCQYDLIICNPPFYPAHLPSAHPQRRQAFHQESLSYKELADSCQRLLAPEGKCSILLPPRQAGEFTSNAFLAGLHLQKQLIIHPSSAGPPHRIIGLYGKEKKENPEEEKLCIHSADGKYSPEFQELLKPFYLIF